MRASRFNVCLPDEPRPGSMLIFNTLSGSLFVLEPEYRRSLEALQQGRELDAADVGRLAEMADEGFVVQSAEAEKQALIHHMRNVAYSAGDVFEAKVMTTSACNLACKYCFESHMDRAQRMDEDTARRVAERILTRAVESRVGAVKLHLYGGEPLLNLKAAEVLASVLRAGCDENGLGFGMTMTTNGTLLTPDTVRRLMDWGLTAARVSLDGVKEIHDAQRPFRSGSGSCFDAVMANLEQVTDMLPVQVLTVCDPDHPEKFELFLDELERRGLAGKIERILPAIEMGILDGQGAVCNPEQCMVTADVGRAKIEFQARAAKRGLKSDDDRLASGGCALCMEGALWIFTPRGEIHKCTLLMGQPGQAMGSLDSPAMNELYHRAVNFEPWLRCLEETDCPYIPSCGAGSGCRVSALAEHGDLWGPACPRQFQSAYLPRAMRLELAEAGEGE